MISVHRKITASLAAGGAALLIAMLTPAAAPAAPVNFTCSPTKVKGSVSALDTGTTTSPAFVNIPEATVAFKQGGTTASCVIVRFSAHAFADAGLSLVIRAYLDNTTAALPAEVTYATGENLPGGGARSYEFVFPNVAPGNHLVRMQFRSATGDFAVLVLRHTTVAQFAP